MEIDAVLEAFKDFEKKGKRETCPILEQFLCHVAKKGETLIQWSQFKPYFMFKLEKVMDDFHASSPEQRGPSNPNVEYIPFEEMKKRILKIVDGYNGVPFTIQRLCELLVEPKRNYSGTEKFLRGVEKNVMVVSCVYPSSEKNGAAGGNRVNGVMFSSNASIYADSRNVNGPGAPRSVSKPKLPLATPLSTNGLLDSPVSKEPEPSTEGGEEHPISDSSSSEAESWQVSGTKKKHEEEDDPEAEQHEAKKLRFGEDEEESEEKLHSCPAGSGSSPQIPETSRDTAGEEKVGSSAEGQMAEDCESSSEQTEPPKKEDGSANTDDSTPSPASSLKSDSTVDQSEQPGPPEKIPSSEVTDKEESSDQVSSSSSNNESEGKDTLSDTLTTTPSNTAEQPAEGAAEGTPEESSPTAMEKSD